MSMTDYSQSGAGQHILTAMFDDRASAQRAVDALVAGGIPSSAIAITGGEVSGAAVASGRPYEETHKGFWDALGDFFFPDDDRYTYAEGLSRGGVLVTVRGYQQAQEEMIVDVLDHEGSVDLDSREREWRASGWTSPHVAPGHVSDAHLVGGGLGAAAAGVGATVANAWDATKDAVSDVAHDVAHGTARAASGVGDAFDNAVDRATDGTVKVVEESLAVGTRAVDHGAVRVRSYVRAEDVSADVNLHSTRVHIERRAVDRPVTDAEAAFQDRVIEARETSEEAVVAKEARVVEEIGLRQEQDVRTETVTDTVRKTEVEIIDERTGERTDLDGNRL